MSYILFTSSSDSRFRITARSACWDGIIEYSYNNQIWKEWHGETIINNKIYMRGINNTQISCCNPWRISGSNVKCQGNIENLLDYKSVINNVHPVIKENCFYGLFFNCQALIEPPQLLFTTLPLGCCQNMFYNCKSLITSPMFANLYIAKESIVKQRMLENCPIQKINVNNKLYDVNVLKL